MTVAATELELVACPLMNAGQKQFPDTTFAAQPHRVATPIPHIEITHDADARGVRGPDGKSRAADTQHGGRLCAKHLKWAQMSALAE